MSKSKTIPPIRATEKQYSDIKAAADKVNRTITDWIRHCAVKESARVLRKAAQ